MTEGPVQFGKYLLDGEIATGGMSKVFLARLRGPGGFEKKLVVKQILPRLAQDPSFIEMFVREANTLVQMSHPSIVPVFELGVVDGVYFLAMERVEGATAHELLRAGRVPEAQVAHMAIQICDALRFAHERYQIVHRDVTARNVIIDRDGHARLLDFGIAAPVESTGDGSLFGSPGYMSPEQIRGQALVPASDLFSLGVVMYELLSGKPPFARDAKQIPSAPPEKLGSREDVSDDIAQLIHRMLQPNQASRPESAQEVATELRTWLSTHHPQGVATPLGVRVADAMSTRTDEDSKPVTPASGSGDGGEVRSIATSAVLDEIIQQATEKLERPKPNAPPLRRDEGEDEEANSARGRVERFILLTFAMCIGVFAWTTMRQPTNAPLTNERAQDVAEANMGSAVPEPSTATPVSKADAGHTDAGVAAGNLLPPPSPSEQATRTERAVTPTKATLSVNAIPWAKVSLDGQAAGTTPQRVLRTTAGKHVLVLDCPPLGAKARVPLDLAAGSTTSVLVDLNQSPPKITTR